MSIKWKIDSLIKYILAAILVINCQSIYLTIPNISNIVSNFCMYVFLLGTLVLLILKPSYSKRQLLKTFVWAISLIAYALIYLVARPESIKRLGILIAISLCLLALYFLQERNCLVELLNNYANIVFCISLISMFFWFFGSMLHVIQLNQLVSSNWTGDSSLKGVKSFMYVYFEPQYAQFMGRLIMRNSAIFAEGPMAAFNFSVALLAYKYLLPKKPGNVRKILILCVAIATTLSAIGFSIIMIIALDFWNTRKISTDFQRITKWLINIGMVVVLINIGYSILSQKMQAYSGQFRTNDIVSSYYAWKEHMIWGTGLGNPQGIYNYFPFSRLRLQQYGLSTGLMTILAEGGLYLSLPYICILIKNLIIFTKEKRLSNVIVTLLIYYLWFMVYTPFQFINILLLILLGTLEGHKDQKESVNFGKV